MKLLLDESVPVRLAGYFPAEFSVFTVSGIGWAGTKNGALLARATAEEFYALLSADKGIEYQQNLKSLTMVIVVLVAQRNRLQEFGPLVPRIVELLNRQSKPGVYHVAK